MVIFYILRGLVFIKHGFNGFSRIVRIRSWGSCGLLFWEVADVTHQRYERIRVIRVNP
ncbi:MAG: hypothetical protein FWG87_04855 [Defluviitaleaceae bacterium]|nr:hypothetical protein [Defluviitaleaceae bacterium]